jgi:hypothetical protein
MKKSLLLLLPLILSCYQVNASDDDKYEICEIWGMASAYNDGLSGGVSLRIIERLNLMNGKICLLKHNDAVDFINTEIKKKRNYTPENIKRMEKYNEFKRAVLDHLIDKSGMLSTFTT